MAASANAEAIAHLTKGLELIELAPGIGRADLAGDRLPPRARPPAYCHTRVGICRGAGRLHPSQGVVCGRRRHPRALSQPCGVVDLSCDVNQIWRPRRSFPGSFSTSQQSSGAMSSVCSPNSPLASLASGPDDTRVCCLTPLGCGSCTTRSVTAGQRFSRETRPWRPWLLSRWPCGASAIPSARPSGGSPPSRWARRWLIRSACAWLCWYEAWLRIQRREPELMAARTKAYLAVAREQGFAYDCARVRCSKSGTTLG